MIKPRRMRWGGHVVVNMGEEECISSSPLFTEGKRPLGRPRCRWVDNINMDLREIGWSGMDWIDLAQDGGQWRALVNMVMNLWFP
jgi:hypothetical protein